MFGRSQFVLILGRLFISYKQVQQLKLFKSILVVVTTLANQKISTLRYLRSS